MSGPLQAPKISDGYLGKQAKFDEFGLETISHPEPIIELDTNEIEIHIGYGQPTRFTTKLMLCGTGGKENPDWVMVNNLQGRMCYTITVPQIGYYKFQIYALPLTEAGPNMVGVFNYLILVKEVNEEMRPYPKQYPPWKNGCYMWEPRGIPRGCRAPGVPFKMHIPNAVQVMVRAGEEWTELTKVEEDVFQGLVDFSKPDMANGGKVHVNVKTKGQSQFVMVRAGEEWTELTKVEENVFQGVVDFSKPDMVNGGKVHVNVKTKGQSQFVTYLEYVFG